MRAFFVLVLAVVLSGCMASMQEVPEDQRSFSGVFDAPGFSADQVFDGARLWVAENFRSSKEVIEYSNKATGVFVGNGAVKYPCGGLDCLAKNDWRVHYTMKVEVKAGRFKLTFSNLELSWPPSGAQAGHRGAMWQQGDFDLMRPVLLAQGDEIKRYLQAGDQSGDW